MRIRKRAVPLPLSSLLPIPLSDLPIRPSIASSLRHRYAATQDGLLDNPQNLNLCPPISTSPQKSTSSNDSWRYTNEGGQKRSLDVENKDEEEDEGRKGGSRNQLTVATRRIDKCDTGKEIGDCATEGDVVRKEGPIPLPILLSIEGENAVGGKRKRGGHKLLKEEGEYDVGGRGKKEPREILCDSGSRCSRMNGRGWRCCQQTLVGYSLCEHHLGKGRVRSMARVGSRSIDSSPKLVKDITVSSSAPKNEDGELINAEFERPTTNISRKRERIGMVKARSLRSLLAMTAGPGNVVSTTESSDQLPPLPPSPK